LISARFAARTMYEGSSSVILVLSHEAAFTDHSGLVEIPATVPAFERQARKAHESRLKFARSAFMPSITALPAPSADG
jgi:hypothetical protein